METSRAKHGASKAWQTAALPTEMETGSNFHNDSEGCRMVRGDPHFLSKAPQFLNYLRQLSRH